MTARPGGNVISIVTAEPWITDAACRGVDPDLFFPERGESTRQAKAVCAGCDVRDLCLEYAIREGLKHGIFGGKSEAQRRKMRRANPAVAWRFPKTCEVCGDPFMGRSSNSRYCTDPCRSLGASKTKRQLEALKRDRGAA